MNAIEINALSKRFNGVQALNGLDMQVKEGSVYGFLGPNGAGKTTTLRILAGLARSDGGNVTIDGVKAGILGKSLPQVGYLPEEPAFYSWMTPVEYLDFTGRIFHLESSERKNRVAEMIQLSGLQEAQKRKIGGFSRGMRQRLGIVQTLMNKPRVLLLDEPVSALDPSGRKDVLDLIEGLRAHCTILMSTHILADVERVCDTVGIIRKGQMITQAERTELLERYAVSALELELANGQVSRMDEIAARIRVLDGVNKVKIVNHCLRIQVIDVIKVQQTLMRTLLDADIHFERLEIVRPSLEEIFIHLTGEEEGQK